MAAAKCSLPSLAHLILIIFRYNEWHGFLTQIEMTRAVFDMDMTLGVVVFIVCKKFYIARKDL